MNRIIAIKRADGGIAIMHIPGERFLPPVELVESARVSAVELAEIQQKAAAAQTEDDAVMLGALVTIAKVKARQTADALRAATPDPTTVIRKAVEAWDLSARGPDPMDTHQIAMSWREVTQAELDALDRTYRGAWLDDAGLLVDQAKARDLHRKILRREREALMQELDVAMLRALEIEDDAERKEVMKVIAERKQLLRDAPSDPRIDAAKTIEDLKAIRL